MISVVLLLLLAAFALTIASAGAGPRCVALPATWAKLSGVPVEDEQPVG